MHKVYCLAPELTLQILQHLEVKDLFHCRIVNVHWYHAASFILSKKIATQLQLHQQSLSDVALELDVVRKINRAAQQANSIHLRITGAHIQAWEEVKRYTRPIEEVHRVFQYLLVVKGDIAMDENGHSTGLLPWMQVRKLISRPSFKQWLHHLGIFARVLPYERVQLIHTLFTLAKVRDSLNYGRLLECSKPGYFMLVLLAAMVRHADLEKEIDDKEKALDCVMGQVSLALLRLKVVNSV
jgi:hypothetical protein